MTVACQLCRAKFEAVVALDMHIREEHPGGLGPYRGVLRDLYRQEREAKRSSEAATGKLHPALEALYRLGCPCGKSLTAHQRIHRALGGIP